MCLVIWCYTFFKNSTFKSVISDFWEDLFEINMLLPTYLLFTNFQRINTFESLWTSTQPTTAYISFRKQSLAKLCFVKIFFFVSFEKCIFCYYHNFNLDDNLLKITNQTEVLSLNRLLDWNHCLSTGFYLVALRSLSLNKNSISLFFRIWAKDR